MALIAHTQGEYSPEILKDKCTLSSERISYAKAFSQHVITFHRCPGSLDPCSRARLATWRGAEPGIAADAQQPRPGLSRSRRGCPGGHERGPAYPHQKRWI